MAKKKTRFESLADQWERETRHLSSPTRSALHPAHLAIVRMGQKVIPLILSRMRKRGGHWFMALSALTGENPIPESSRGRIYQMQQAWLKWGKAHGYKA